MKKIILTLVMILLTVACSSNATDQQLNENDPRTFLAGTIEALSQQPPATITQPSPIVLGTEVVTLTSTAPSAFPTTLPIPTPLSSDIFSSPIQFDANGTYKDILVDDIPAGGTKAFSINAMKGQIMSVSTWRQDGTENYLPQIRILGVSGSTLCPTANRQCLFWRGVLPSTQNYFVIFTADPNWGAAGFMMRVAVNAPGTDRQYFQYRNKTTGVLLTYNDAFAPTGGFLDGYISTGAYKIRPELILHLIDTKTFENTNLSAVYLTIGSTKDAQVVSACLNTDWDGMAEQVVGKEVINGYEFFHTERDGIASGHYGEQENYRMVYGGFCYEVIYHIHSVNIGNFSPGAMVVEFDRKTILQELNEIFSSFRID